MNKGIFPKYNSDVSHGGFLSRNNPRNNAFKFQKPVGGTEEKPTAKSEIEKWITNNSGSDVKIQSYSDDKILMEMSIQDGSLNQEHVIEITYPKNYPTIKKGFACQEITKEGLTPISFIKKANQQFENKILSIDRVLTHLATTFASYKRRIEEKVASPSQAEKSPVFGETEPTSQVIFNPESTNEVEAWQVAPPVTGAASEIPVTADQPNSDSSLSSDEMINLEPTVSTPDEVTDISTDIELINRILQNTPQEEIIGKDVDEPVNETNESTNSVPAEILPLETTDDPFLENDEDDEQKENDDRPNEEEIFDLDPENVIKKRSPNVSESVILSNPSFDEFVAKHAKLIETQYPDMEEDKIMDMIQTKWENETKKANTGSFPDADDDPLDEKVDDPIDFMDEESEESEEPVTNQKVITIEKDSDESESEEEEEDLEESKPANISNQILMVDEDDEDDEDEEPNDEDIEAIEEKSEEDDKPVKKPAKAAKSTVVKQTTTKPTVQPNEISFDDVDDTMGLYWDLTKYTKSTKLPFDMDKLFENAKRLQQEMDFGNSTRVKKSFSSEGAVRVAINEFKRIYLLGQRNHFTVQPVNDNVYHLKLKFGKESFNPSSKIYADITKYGKSIELDIQIDSKLYPFYPLKVRLLTPRLKNSMDCRIATMECLLLTNWSPLYNMETIITEFQKLMELHAEVDPVLGNYDDLENELIELSLLSEIPARANAFLTIEELRNIKENSKNIGTEKSNSTGKKTGWARGTGMSDRSSTKWDVESTMKAKEEQEKQLCRCIKNITKRLTKIILNNINIDDVGIMQNSCFVPYMKSIFNGNNILELLKNRSQFELLLNSMRIMTSKFVPLYIIKENDTDKSLYEIFQEINSDCATYAKTMKQTDDTSNDIKAELDLVNNFINFFKKLRRQVKEYELTAESKNNEPKRKDREDNTTKTLEDIYRAELGEELCQPFEEMNLSHFAKLVKDANETTKSDFILPDAIRRISKELLSHKKSMPLNLASSIFYRYNPDNLKYHEFLIAAPEGTPYDSGCFHFRIYCTSEYPRKNPKVNIYTTGNGTFRFNPNLYEDGKVCLSILGTYDGEAWMPEISTMLQIMVSIQSMVLIPDPYFNEPGYANDRGTPRGDSASQQYNEPVRLNTMKWAMIDQIKNPTPGFENAIKKHFRLKANYIRKTCGQWVAEATPSYSSQFKKAYSELCKELDKLTGDKTNAESYIKMEAKPNPAKKVPAKSTKAKKIVDV